MTLRLLAFDFDGTLVNTEPGIVAAIAHTVDALGLPPAARQRWRDMVGLPLSTQLATLLPPHRQQEVPRGADLFRQYQRAHDLAGGEPYDGVADLLDQLQGRLPLAIASSKGRGRLLDTLRQLGWAERFDPIITPSEVAQPKPHPESLSRILRHHGVAATEAVYIGDTIFDMQTARRAGVVGWGAGWGFHPATELRRAGAQRCFDDPCQLGRLVRDLLSR